MNGNMAIEACKKFVQTVEDTGGVFQDDDGLHRPVGDPDWVDLGEAYIAACNALRQEPVYGAAPEEFSLDEDDGL